MSNIPLGGQGALRRDTEQGSEFADRQRAGAHFARILVSAVSRGRLTALSTTSSASHEHGREHGIWTASGPPIPTDCAARC